jgi:hypothetical protein
MYTVTSCIDNSQNAQGTRLPSFKLYFIGSSGSRRR